MDSPSKLFVDDNLEVIDEYDEIYNKFMGTFATHLPNKFSNTRDIENNMKKTMRSLTVRIH